MLESKVIGKILMLETIPDSSIPKCSIIKHLLSNIWMIYQTKKTWSLLHNCYSLSDLQWYWKTVQSIPVCSFNCRLHLQHNSFGATTRLAKRWLASQMLLRHYIAEEAVELLVASLYVTPEPFTLPRYIFCWNFWQCSTSAVVENCCRWKQPFNGKYCQSFRVVNDTL